MASKIESGSTVTPDDIEGPWVRAEDLEELPPEVQEQLPDLTTKINGQPHVPARTVRRLANEANGKINGTGSEKG